MRVLVTGASGFSGAYIARYLALEGHSVVGVYRRETPFLSRLRGVGRIELKHAFLERAADMAGPYDAIVHTAATSPAPGIGLRTMVRDNIDATIALTEAAVEWNCRAFVFFSSMSVFGRVSVPIVDESCPVQDPDAYGTTKYICEQLLLEQADVLPSLSLRLPGVLGPGAHRNWMSSLAADLCARKPVTAFNLEGPYNNAAHVDDIAKFVAQLLRREMTGADAVVLGARGSLKVRAAIERLAGGLGVQLQLKERPASRSCFVLSSRKAIERWGYDPMDIAAMIDRYAADIAAER